jgi:beta-galactosidase
MAKAMGLNTIATYVFWNVHEPTPGRYDFTGNNDLAAFIRAAQEEGLYVILRSGPYSCAEWELGGLPAWLLKDSQTAAAIRSNDPAFMVPAERWIHRLSQEVGPLQFGHGGPILMTQIENEYGNYGADHAYIEHLRQIYLDSGFNASMLFTADNWRNIDKGSIPELLAATNFGIGNHQGGMDALARLRPDAPLFVSEYWPGWFDHWGHPHETRPIPAQLEDLDYILKRGAGINIYMFHGGTSFGFMAGSSWTSNQFLPDVTSYDYDAPLDESGRPTPKYIAYRKVLAKYSSCGDESCLPPIPETPAPINLSDIALTQSASLWQNLPTPIADDQPHSMEHYGQSYGYILYRTQLPADTGKFVLKGFHDYAQVYANQRLFVTLDRRRNQDEFSMASVSKTHPKYVQPLTLDILVANDGRINSTHAMRTEQKGIVGSVISDKPVTKWQVYLLPMTTVPSRFPDDTNSPTKGRALQDASTRTKPGRAVLAPAPDPMKPQPTFFRASFNLNQVGDTFLDISKLGKGAVWINGHPIGRFWNIGPQQTLYVPGPWLCKGANEIIVFDMAPTADEPHVTGLNHPILDGPVTDTATSKQE